MSNSAPKIGLALGGGFFRGLAHIGVLQTLEEQGIPIDCIAGTSMGAVIGALYVSGMDMKLLEKFTLSCNERMFFDLAIPRNGFIKGEKILSLLKTMTGNRDFSQTSMPFAAVACDIESGERVLLTEGKVYEAVRASLAVPGVFAPYLLAGRKLVDGGVVERVPTSAARQLGADVVIAVEVGAREGTYEVHNTMDIMMRAIELMQAQIALSQQAPDVLIAPSVRHINMSKLTQSAECIAIGRAETMRMMPQIRRAIEEVKKK